MSRRVWRTESEEPEAPALTRLCKGLQGAQGQFHRHPQPHLQTRGHTCAGVFPAFHCEMKHTHRRAQRTSLQTVVLSQSGHLCKRPSRTRSSAALLPACPREAAPHASLVFTTGTCISKRQRLILSVFSVIVLYLKKWITQSSFRCI